MLEPEGVTFQLVRNTTKRVLEDLRKVSDAFEGNITRVSGLNVQSDGKIEGLSKTAVAIKIAEYDVRFVVEQSLYRFHEVTGRRERGQKAAAFAEVLRTLTNYKFRLQRYLNGEHGERNSESAWRGAKAVLHQGIRVYQTAHGQLVAARNRFPTVRIRKSEIDYLRNGRGRLTNRRAEIQKTKDRSNDDQARRVGRVNVTKEKTQLEGCINQIRAAVQR